MLVITQKEGEGLIIGDEVKILIKWVHGNKVRFCIKAPRDVLLRRSAEGFPEFETTPEGHITPVAADGKP